MVWCREHEQMLMKKANGLESLLGSRRSASTNDGARSTRALNDDDLDSLDEEEEQLERETEEHDPDERATAAPKLSNEVIDCFLRRRT
jgi:hypothetical protein